LIDEQTQGCVRTVHAEQNALIYALGGAIIGATAYTTLSPCWVCMRLLVQAGVKRVVYATEYRLGVERQQMLADGAGVLLEHVPYPHADGGLYYAGPHLPTVE
jgi:dCMP deaminase